MTKPENDIEALRRKASDDLAQAKTRPEVEAWRIKYLGRKGVIPQFLRRVKDLPLSERKVSGQAGNALRRQLEEHLQEKLKLTPAITKQKRQLSAPVPGSLHPLTLSVRRLQQIFSELGFTWFEGPFVEDVAHDFDLINIPPTHPARAETDTFYLTNGHLMRTQVTACQIRGPLELKLKPPFKIVYPGQTFRAEKVDATHEATFHQYEFMVVDANASLADLKGVIEHVYSEFFETDLKIRFRPGYFPFVEPGLEIDASCLFCQAKGCSICKHTGWIEMAGAGSVHPAVLKNINLDPAKVQGYALGGGTDRLAMLKYGIKDVRQLRSGDMKAMSKFS